MRLGMVINLPRCVGCQTCEAICKIENGVPKGIFFNRTVDHEVGEYPNVSRELFPVVCMHCENPPCMNVCSADAIHQTDSGIVWVDEDECRGCEACVNACPLGMMSYFDGDVEYFERGEKTPIEKKIEESSSEGVALKCDFCLDRISSGMEEGLTPGECLEATPFCVVACPTEARTFGDLDDPESEVSKIIEERDGFQLKAYEGIEPAVYYVR